ncbi:MAG TPA: SGNH/GDSL hydrolase family protein [Euzebya sp.]|nr:SGNH/GDSL hydrolase family protein [Euzebya sp.]
MTAQTVPGPEVGSAARMVIAAALTAAAVPTMAAMAWQATRLRSLIDMPVPTYAIRATVGDGSDEPLQLAVLGDSLVAGVGAPHREQSLPWQLAEVLAGELARRVHVVGLGKPSATTDQVRAQVARMPSGTDVVVVVSGANDVRRHTSPQVFCRAFDALLADILRTDVGLVVTTGMPDFRSVSALAPGVRGSVAIWSQHLHTRQRRAAAAHGALFVDLKSQVAHTFRGDPAMFGADGFHPSPQGYALLARTLGPPIATALRGRPRGK